MYRGTDIGGRERLTETCLRILEEGHEKKLYEALPHISIVRSPLFFDPLLKLLQSGNREQREFSAVALGSLGDPRAIEPLYKVFMRPATFKGKGTGSLQASIINALGEMGDDQAVELLLNIYKLASRGSPLVSQRKSWVLSAIGNLAQQGAVIAVKELTNLMREKDTELRAQAVMELAVAYWHRPSELPDTVLQEMISLTEDDSEEVRQAALSALSDLAQLGCQAAERYK
jgi:HEAT repeat protein